MTDDRHIERRTSDPRGYVEWLAQRNASQGQPSFSFVWNISARETWHYRVRKELGNKAK